MTQEHRYAQGMLDYYLDGELADSDRLALEEHLSRCDECLDELEGLRELRDAARSLPREIVPPRDLWAGIAARLEEAPERHGPKVVHVDFAAPRRRKLPAAWVIRIAAGLALVVASSGVTALLLRSPAAMAPVATVPAATTTPPAGEPLPTALAAFEPTEQEYLGAVEVLAVELEARKAELAPETVATVEESLRIIDAAIDEARAALERDPGNAELPLLLSGVYRKKVGLLRQAIDLPRGS